MWMQDGCKVYTDSYTASNESCFTVTWSIFKNHLLEVGLTQNHQETMALRTLTNRWFILLYHVWGPTWIECHWNSIWSRDPVTYDFTLHLRACDHTTWLWRCVGTAFGHFLLGSHNFMVTALGSFVTWPQVTAIACTQFQHGTLQAAHTIGLGQTNPYTGSLEARV